MPKTTSEIKSRRPISNPSVAKPNTRIVAIDLNPATYSDSFDLTTELSDNREFYTGEECVTLRPLPGYLVECMERYKLSFSSHRPGMNAISSACIWGGLQSLGEHDFIKDLSAMPERLRKHNRSQIQAADTDRYDICVNWFNSFPVDVFNSGGSRTNSLNVSLPDKIKARLNGTCKSLSMSQGALGAILIADIIRDQDTTLPGHKSRLDDAVNTFLILCQARLGALESILEMLGKK